MKKTMKHEGVRAGQIHGRLLVIGEPTKKGKSHVAPCRCACGEKITTDVYHLFSGRTRTWGCKGGMGKGGSGKFFEATYLLMLDHFSGVDPTITGFSLMFRTPPWIGMGRRFRLSILDVERGEGPSSYGWQAVFDTPAEGYPCAWAGDVHFRSASEAARAAYRHLEGEGILDAGTAETCARVAEGCGWVALRAFMAGDFNDSDAVPGTTVSRTDGG